MATHSSVLAWRIPGTGEPGELPSMGSHRVGHDCSNLAAVAAAATLNIFSCAFWLSECLLWRNVYLGLLPILLIGLFVFLTLSCMCCLYIFEINLLLVASFANIFSHSVVFFFFFNGFLEVFCTLILPLVGVLTEFIQSMMVPPLGKLFPNDCLC